MDVVGKLREIRSELSEDAETVGLSPHDALLYWGDESYLFETLSNELDGESFDYKSDVMQSVIDRLASGELIGLAMIDDSGREQPIPSAYWLGCEAVSDDSRYAAYLDEEALEDSRDFCSKSRLFLGRLDKVYQPNRRSVWVDLHQLSASLPPALTYRQFSDFGKVIICEVENLKVVLGSHAEEALVVPVDHTDVTSENKPSRNAAVREFLAAMAQAFRDHKVTTRASAVRFVIEAYEQQGKKLPSAGSLDALTRRMDRAFAVDYPELTPKRRRQRVRISSENP